MKSPRVSPARGERRPGLAQAAQRRRPGRRSQPEAALHRAIVDYLRVALPDAAVWTTFPAGGGGPVRGAQLKRAGLMQGWPDLQILWSQELIGGSELLRFIGLEIKAPAGRTSEAQVRCHVALRAIGAHVAVVRSVADVEAVLRRLGMRLRARAT